MKFLCVFLLCIFSNLTASQSTCPVLNLDAPHKCKCGIKTDGQIYIYCARKQLKRLPRFTRSSILYEELILSGNQIERIGAGAFAGLKVKRLFLDENPLVEIEANAFTELANYLEELVISVSPSILGFARPRLPETLFQNLLNLKIVKMSNLEFFSGVIKQSTFNRTRKLEVVHLVDCNLASIEFNSFAGLEFSLKELNLENNQLNNVNSIFNEIKRMRRLQSLILSRNKIRNIDAFLPSLTDNDFNKNTEFYLDLSYNSITQIDENSFFADFSNSQLKLNLNNNELNQFQLSFIAQLPSLKELSLDYNKIESIPDNLFINSRSLESLSLRGNLLSKIESEYAFAGLHFNLKRLNLASNKIHSIGKRVFMQVTKLRELNLERNFLGVHFDNLAGEESFGGVFEGVEGELKWLSLENNKLKPAHLNALVNLLNVETLKIGHNLFASMQLKFIYALDKFNSPPEARLTKTFEFYRNLSVLDIQNSSLIQLPYFAGLNRSLLVLNAAQNQICNVNAKNLKFFYSRVKSLNLNQNPLSCDCALNGLRKWLGESGERNETNGWKCAQPEPFQFKLVSQLNNELPCQFDHKCNLDQDEFMFKQAQITSTTTTTTTTKTTEPQTTTETTTTTTTFNDQIKIVDTFFTKPLLSTFNIIPKVEQHIQQQQQQQPQQQSSFFTSVELRQTLLGSLIGALSVLIIVCFIVCAIKTTQRKFSHKDVSLCGSEKDKSTTATTATTTQSPYDLSKLSLQTLCLNSGCNSNGSNSSGSSSSSSGGSTMANSSCVCNLLSNNFDQFQPEMFTKMDPMRLTMISSASNIQRASLHQHYLNSCVTQNHLQHANLHYLASHLPYSPTAETSNSSPSPSDDKNNNTYDKLHQQQRINNNNANNNASFKLMQFNTLMANQHVLNKCFNLGELACANRTTTNTMAETTPFLIHMANENKLMPTSLQQQQFLNEQADYQHTYHEIGDVLFNLNATMRNAPKSANEMFI